MEWLVYIRNAQSMALDRLTAPSVNLPTSHLKIMHHCIRGYPWSDTSDNMCNVRLPMVRLSQFLRYVM